jgi:hypothetical protein
MAEDVEDLISRLREKWTRADSLKLHAGEMTAQELRTAKAVANAIIAEAASALSSLSVRVEELEKALEPFAKAAGMEPVNPGPDGEQFSGDEPVSINLVGYGLGDVTLADLRRAREVTGVIGERK